MSVAAVVLLAAIAPLGKLCARKGVATGVPCDGCESWCNPDTKGMGWGAIFQGPGQTHTGGGEAIARPCDLFSTCATCASSRAAQMTVILSFLPRAPRAPAHERRQLPLLFSRAPRAPAHERRQRRLRRDQVRHVSQLRRGASAGQARHPSNSTRATRAQGTARLVRQASSRHERREQKGGQRHVRRCRVDTSRHEQKGPDHVSSGGPRV